MGEIRRLPEAFCERMKQLLGAEYEAFLASYECDRHYGLRWNPLKASASAFLARMPYRLTPVSWAAEGYYYQEEEQPGKGILHEAGAYYIQEPSAMAVVEILDPKPGERILDLCAAPGGKTTQIAGRMKGEGLLIANELIPGRAKILSQNVERMGVRNCVVCNETPEHLAALFPGFFDRIVVDAPCSGEGMFRKDGTAVEEWSGQNVRICADRQLTILEEAAGMLRPGGVLVYSTCTFAPEENEGTISRFLHGQEDFIIEEVPHDGAFAPGRAEWVEEPAQGIEHTMRLWPHRLRGEGHYIARLRRRGMAVCPVPAQGADPEWAKQTEQTRQAGGRVRQKSRKDKTQHDMTAYGRSGIDDNLCRGFFTEELGLAKDWLDAQGGSLAWFGDQLYLVPASMISMQGMKVIRPGLHLGTGKKNRLEPSHSLALALGTEETDRVLELSQEEALRYLHGESFPCGTQRGWTLLCYRGFALGFGKAVNGQMKNHYPRGLRK